MVVRAEVPSMDSGASLSRSDSPRVLTRVAASIVLAAILSLVLMRAGLHTLSVPASTAHAMTAAVFVAFALTAPIACAICGFLAPLHERRGWSLLALGSALMVSGDAVSLASGGSGALGAASETPAATIVWASSFAVFFVAALGFLDPLPTRLARARRAVDIALVILVVAALVFSAALFPAYGLNAQRAVTEGLFGYTTLALSISLIVVAVAYRPRLRRWHMPLALGLLAVAAGALLETLGPVRGEGVSSAAIFEIADAPLLVAYGMLALAAVVRIRYRHADLEAREVNIARVSRRATIAMLTAVFLALPAFLYLGITWQGDPLGFWVFTGLASMLGLTALGRNVILTFENASLRQRALVDPLTELFNHRYFQERLQAEIDRATREGTPLTLVSFDVDDFNQLNNVYGHAAGDRRLRAIGQHLTDFSRAADIVCRVGGDEFAVIMPNTLPIEAYKVCLRLQESVGQIDPTCPLPTGFSAGIAGVPEHASTREELTQMANGALYWAKFHGREQVVVFDPDLVVALDPEDRIGLLEQESYVQMVQLLACAVDARDPYTQQHSRRVAALAVHFAQSLGLDDEHVCRIETAALLHDVGKIGVADAVLRKSAGLTDREYRQVKEHPRLAARILSAIPRREILPWITSHHERWDGEGYPDGLAAEDIPLEARILSICDAYDAMTSARPYRPPMPTEDALDELLANAGTQFDAALAHSFVNLMRRTHAGFVSAGSLDTAS